MKKSGFIIFILLFYSISVSYSQFISEVLQYTPAPGQFINASPMGVPSAGDPGSSTSIVGRINGIMSLGAFGGYVVFKFEDPVENHPDNPFGIDFVIYGNPLSNPLNSSDKRAGWSEPGIVSVMKDENQNGKADDTWYELAGSEYFFSGTLKNYSITYNNPESESAVPVSWKDNHNHSGKILTNVLYTQPYYPVRDIFPWINESEYTLTGTRIIDNSDTSHSAFIISRGRAWGYADNTLRSGYNGLPDNPYTQEIENSGGDAFDIHWAVNENGDYVDLDKIDFIKVHTAIMGNAGALGEISTEITGAFDVAPEASVSGILDMVVLADVPDTIHGNHYQLEAFIFHKGRWKKEDNIIWNTNVPGTEVDENNLLSFSSSGKLTITAIAQSQPEISASAFTYLSFEDIPANTTNHDSPGIKLFPNPAEDRFFLQGINNGDVSIHDITGKLVIRKTISADNQDINIVDIPPGLYLLRIWNNEKEEIIRFIKN